MLLLSLLCLIGTAFALPVPETEDSIISATWGPVTISLGEESDNLFDDILKAVQVATPIITTLASGKRQLIWNPLDPLIDPIRPILPAKRDVQEDLWQDILATLSTATTVMKPLILWEKRDTEDSIISATWGPVTISLGEESDNLFDDILKAVQVATPIITTLASGKREVQANLIDDLLAQIDLGNIVQPIIMSKKDTEDSIISATWGPVTISLGEESDNLFDDILKAVQVATPIITTLASGKRELIYPLDPLIYNPILPVILPAKRDTEDSIISATWGPVTISLGEESDNLFDDILKAVQVATPIITTLASGKREVQEVFWQDVLDLVSVGVGKKREVQENILEDILTTSLIPTPLVVSKKDAEDGLFSFNIGPVEVTVGEESDNLFEDILQAVQVATPIITAFAGKRDAEDGLFSFNIGPVEVTVGEESDNLFDDILKAVQVATPIVTALASGKRDVEDGFSFNIGPVTVTLGEESDGLFDDILKAVEVATPIITAFAGKRDTEDSISFPLGPVIITVGEESDNLFDDILKAVQVATPIVTALAGK